MKQPLLSLMKTQKLFSLTKSMTENSKNACWLLLSVILLTGTVTGIAGNGNCRSVRELCAPDG